MRFGIPDLESRAAFTAADLQQTGAAFRVWGTYHKSGPSAPVAAATVFDGTVVTRDDAGLWNYDETQYWFPGFTYHFRALFPADFAARSNAAAAIAAADRGDGMHLTVAGFDASKQLDLLADRTLLIPQRLDGCRLTIAYRYAGETADRTASVSLAAVSGALSRWEAGKSYRYRITIGPADFILFEAPTIEPWQESTGGSIRID